MKYANQTAQSLPDQHGEEKLYVGQKLYSSASNHPPKRKGKTKMRFNYQTRKNASLIPFILKDKSGQTNTGCRAVLCLLLIALTAVFGVAQNNTRNTDYSADKSLKSNARVNPSTLAMELSVPVSGYAGRAGHSLPVSFDYSSKLWEAQKVGLQWKTQLGTQITDTQPVFARRTAAGWSSSLAAPRIDYKYDVYEGYFENNDSEGQILSPEQETDPDADPSANSHELYYVKRLHVQMPDGSTHEFRANDTLNLCGYTPNTCTGTDFTGTFYSVDGTKMRLEAGETSSTLFLPDGSRYLFGQKTDAEPGHLANAYIDRHGNRMTFDAANKQWTDTLGRVLTDPIPLNWIGSQHQTVGDTTISYPGIGSGTVNATFSWRYLKDPNNGESGLNDPSQSLAYYTNMYCFGNYTIPITATHLFNGSNPVRLCSPGASNPGDQFNPVVLTKITLANGSTYQFRYNVYGEIEKIIYPSGGYERFAYAQITPLQATNESYDKVNRGVSDRWVSAKGDGTDEQHWIYTATRTTSALEYKVAVTQPDGTRTEQLIHDEYSTLPKHYGFESAKTGRPYEDRVYSASNQLLRRHLTSYIENTTMVGYTSSVAANRDMRPNREINITFEPGAGSALATMSETVYDTNSDGAYFAHLNPKQSKTYHYISLSLSTAQTASIETIAALFSSSNLAQTSETDYLYDASYKARNIVTLPTETRVKDAAGNVAAKSQIAYDESAYGILSAGTDTQWVDPNTTVRGNPTTSRAWTDVANNNYIETHAQFDNFGNARKAWDARGNLSEVEFSSAYKYAYPTKTISSVPDSTGTNGSSTAFEATSVYDLSTGLVTSTTDANGQTSQMEYNDSLLRPTKVIPPSGAQTVMEYTDTPGAMSVKTKTQIDASNWAESTVYADGLGRTVKTEKKDDAGNVFAETEYDQMGRVKKATNPYRNGETKLWTESTYDDLSRVTKVKTPDNAEVTTNYDLATSGNLGTIVTVTDQAGKQRRSLTNGLGQLARVDEPNNAGNLGTIASPNQSTGYAYDTLNNLTTVVQGVQTRTFQYDSLSRLKQATNPESGMISYTYDANGNLTGKTDARSITTTYAYDNLNRVKTRSYSDSTPAVAYNYDGTGLGSIPSYAKGKLTKVSSSVSETKYDSFDNLGKVLTSQQITDGQTYNFAYAYNLGGMLTEETYPSGRKVKNTIAPDASLSKVETMPSGGAYATRAESFAYTAAGAVSSMKLGNNKWENAQFNSRLQPIQLGLGTSATDQSLWKVNYDYGTTANNGNVLSQTITVPSITPLVQNYTYDSLNRIKSATENIQSSSETWKQTFQYDRYGNRNFEAANTTTLGSCQAAQCNPSIDAANNRFTTNQGYTYDLSGNLLTDAQNRSFVYDAENKQKEVKDASNVSIGQYFYDGDGKRVKKVSQAETTLFAYDASGKLAAEYTLTSATPQTATTSYLTSDTLGSPRVITDTAGNVTSRRDFMPFGEEIAGLGNRTSASGYQADSTRQKFTGYERDGESDLDFAQARMFESSLGRFTSPDPLFSSGRIGTPQSWNRYSYVLSNPLSLVDPTGLYEWGANLIDNKNLSQEERDKRKTLRENFKSALTRARNNLNTIRERYGSDSKQYQDAKRSLAIYKEENDKGVVVNSGSIEGGGAEVSNKKDSNGNAVVVFNTSDLGVSADILQALVAHEGIHLDDVSTGRRSKLSDYEEEFSGNYNQSIFLEAEDKGLGIFGDGITYNSTVFGTVLYSSSWGLRTVRLPSYTGENNLDIRVSLAEETRRKAVDAVLLNGYGLSPQNPYRKKK